jgi:Transposase DDE domain group 1
VRSSGPDCHAASSPPTRCASSSHALAYNLANFMRTLAMPKTAEPWSLTSLRERLIKIGAKVTSQGRYVTFQMAEIAVPRQMFVDILSLIARLRAPPAPA